MYAPFCWHLCIQGKNYPSAMEENSTNNFMKKKNEAGFVLCWFANIQTRGRQKRNNKIIYEYPDPRKPVDIVLSVCMTETKKKVKTPVI